MRYRFLQDAVQISLMNLVINMSRYEELVQSGPKTDTQHNINPQIEYVII